MQADIDFPILELMKPGHRILFAPEVIYQKQQRSPNQSVFPPVPACSILWLLKQLEGKKKERDASQPSRLHIAGKSPAHRKLWVCRIYIPLIPAQKQLNKFPGADGSHPSNPLITWI